MKRLKNNVKQFDHTMNRNTIITLALFTELLVCLPLIGAPTKSERHHQNNQSGIIGQVHSYALVQVWNVRVVSEKGKFVTNFVTDENGNFQVDLKPGHYVLLAYIPDYGPFPPIIGFPVKVTVHLKRVAPVVLIVPDITPG